MRRVFLAFLVLISTMNCSPVFGQENIKENATEYNESYTEFIEQVDNLNHLNPRFAVLIEDFNKITKYCTGNHVNIRKEPNTNSLVLGQLFCNTSVEVLAEYDGWTCITTENGIAFVSSQYLSDSEVPVYSNRWKISLSDEEFNILCRIMQLEGGVQSDLGQQANTEVIFNRVVDPDFPDDVISVLSQSVNGYAQFSTWKSRDSKHAVPSDRVKSNVQKVLNGETNILPMNTVYFSCGGENRKIQSEIDGHIYCNK